MPEDFSKPKYNSVQKKHIRTHQTLPKFIYCFKHTTSSFPSELQLIAHQKKRPTSQLLLLPACGISRLSAFLCPFCHLSLNLLCYFNFTQHFSRSHRWNEHETTGLGNSLAFPLIVSKHPTGPVFLREAREQESI